MSSDDQEPFLTSVLRELCRMMSALSTFGGAFILFYIVLIFLSLAMIVGAVLGIPLLVLFIWLSYKLMKYQYREMEKAAIYWHLLLIAVVWGVPLWINT